MSRLSRGGSDSELASRQLRRPRPPARRRQRSQSLRHHHRSKVWRPQPIQSCSRTLTTRARATALRRQRRGSPVRDRSSTRRRPRERRYPRPSHLSSQSPLLLRDRNPYSIGARQLPMLGRIIASSGAASMTTRWTSTPRHHPPLAKTLRISIPKTYGSVLLLLLLQRSQQQRSSLSIIWRMMPLGLRRHRWCAIDQDTSPLRLVHPHPTSRDHRSESNKPTPKRLMSLMRLCG